jgi:type II secretory pathway component PulJ
MSIVIAVVLSSLCGMLCCVVYTTYHSNNRHVRNKKEEKQLTQVNLANNRRIRRKDTWSITATDTKPNRTYGNFKLFKN